jgi:hypothetical protein
MIREGTGVLHPGMVRNTSEIAPRVHLENYNPNKKIEREASVHVRQDHFLKNLRPKQAFYYDRVPNEKVE